MTIEKLMIYIKKVIKKSKRRCEKLMDKSMEEDLDDFEYVEYHELCGAVKALEALKEILNG